MILLTILLVSPVLAVALYIFKTKKKRDKAFTELKKSFDEHDKAYLRATEALDKMIKQQDEFLNARKPKEVLKADQSGKWAAIYDCVVATGVSIAPKENIVPVLLWHNAQLDYAVNRYQIERIELLIEDEHEQEITYADRSLRPGFLM